MQEQDITNYLDHLNRNGLQETTTKRYEYDLLLFLQWLHNYVKSSEYDVKTLLNTKTLEMYLKYSKRKRGCSDTSLKRLRGVIINFLTFYNVKLEPFEKEKTTKLTAKNFASHHDLKRLLETMESDKGLSEYQAEGRVFVRERNLLIVRLMKNYGLSINEIVALTMLDINLAAHTLHPGNRAQEKRTIKLSENDWSLLYSYYMTIPEGIRPKYDKKHTLFVAFAHAPGTFTFDYKTYEPKPLTKIAIQRMIQKENKRAGTSLTPTMIRNRYILDELKKGTEPLELKEKLGMKTIEALYRYIEYVNT